MVNSNKILTVSYGTFSCTLEGFDDSFETMKAIAEYFRDLAADDRYFGAEPPTPDAEMLARIAEREIARRVEARTERGSIVLRASEDDRQGLAAPAPEPAADTPAADTASVEPQPKPEPRAAEPRPARPDPDSVAAKLQRIRAVVSKSHSTPSWGDADDEAAFFAGSAASGLIDGAEGDDVAETRLGDLIGRTARRTAIEDAEDAEEAEPAETATTSEPEPAQSAAEDTPATAIPDEPVVDSQEAAEIGVATSAEPFEAEAGAADEPAATGEMAAKAAEAEATQPVTDLEAASTSDLSGWSEPTGDTHAFIADEVPSETPADLPGAADETGIVAALDDMDSDAGTHEALDAADPAEATEEAEAEEDAVATDAETPAEPFDAGQEIEDEAVQIDPAAPAMVDAAADGDDLDVTPDAEPSVLSDAADNDAEPEAADAAQDQDDTAEDDAEDEALNLFADSADTDDYEDEASADAEDLSSVARTRARILHVTTTDVEITETDVPATAAGSLPVSAEAELQAELARVEAEIAAGAALDGVEDDTEDDEWEAVAAAARAEVEAAESRDAEEAASDDDEAASDDDGPLLLTDPILSDDAHAGAEASADDDQDDADQDDDGDDARSAAARSLPRNGDEEASVSRLMAETDSQMNEPEGQHRRAAIAHLRAAVAATKAEKNAGGDLRQDPSSAPYRADLASVVRPRRPLTADRRTERPEPMRAAPLKLVAEQRIDAVQDAGGQPIRPRRVSSQVRVGDSTGFVDFAAGIGAESMPDLIEAAAAYLAFVEGHADFSRPQLMTRVRLVETTEFSREDGLRHFGQLLREGKLERVQSGRFTVSENIKFRPEARAAAAG